MIRTDIAIRARGNAGNAGAAGADAHFEPLVARRAADVAGGKPMIPMETPVVLHALAGSEGAGYGYRLPVPPGHAALMLHAVAARVVSFEAQLDDLARQVDAFRARYALARRDCRALTLFAASLSEMECAAAFVRAMGVPGMQTTVIARLADPCGRVSLNAWFLRKN